ncbi:response regulator [Mucilaginibacter phyllosphaerae]|uniref:DNA-binding response OmpR family regulator n=1 Tax=Mucilaginibacter phyllosphaerae TaxID=1812349 RepID=A0A4Y8AEY9_9SPHI|nr:response regulator [Mucilaginibacter phyllosphaerae]MBB3970279.1 DNA-binding response OmpR family regulator [Mucilaginibacter phyllosphaerae]TEW66655.1 response regulator [Mucilaginibacter phyllosphaerae]GGH10994.1 hypothetical protein GCM10007352_17040 [Mucilaginibacter phyllosphaerae]
MSKKILICDDDEGILDMLEFVLEEEGFDIIPEKNSLNIYNVIREQHPDLLLLDLWMPVLSGDQVLKTLRKNPDTATLPVIVISASTEGSLIAKASGANDYISKPFDMDQLVTKIQTLI